MTSRTIQATPARSTTGTTYAAWVSWIERFRRGEYPPTDRLGPIHGHLGSYVEARALEKLSSAFTERVRQWQSALGERIVAHPPEDSADAAALLREAVAGLDPLARLAGSSLLPRALSVSMHTVLGQVRDGARRALEDAWRRYREELAASRSPAGVPTGLLPDVPRPRLSGGGGRAGVMRSHPDRAAGAPQHRRAHREREQ